MGALVLVHPDPHWGEQFKQESARRGIQTLVFMQMSDTIEVLQNSATPISAFYFSVKTPGSSLLATLALCSIHRPVTPVFLLGQPPQDHFKELNIRGTFPDPVNASMEFEALLAPLNRAVLESISSSAARPMGTRSDPGYVAIPTCDFHDFLTYPNDVFIQQRDGTMKLFASAQSPVELGYLLQASRYSPWLYISEAPLKSRRAALKIARTKLLDLHGISADWIRCELLYEATRILRQLRKELPSDEIVDRSTEFLGDFFKHIVNLSRVQNSDELKTFIEEAARTDRALGVLTSAMLICAHFRFEKSAVVEILGMAALLQDISLIHSPFGNIADLHPDQIPPEARAFHALHPIHSADLLSASTGLSATTLQVIRQHHETKDRTGYPNRVGGTLLHPMAEVLGILSRYAEIKDSVFSTQAAIQRMKSEVFPKFSLEIVQAFESVLLRTSETL